MAKTERRETGRKDAKLEHILKHAARLFSRQSYAATSIRDIAREAKISLSGLYYHFASKEEVLFTLQRDTFAFVIQTAQAAIAGRTDPQRRLAALIEGHITFFVNNMDRMKVLSHESETLNDPYGEQIATMKRDYFKILVTIIEQITARPAEGRTHAMLLFGMMNWIYNWYSPKQDPPADALAAQMARVFLHGIGPTPPAP